MKRSIETVIENANDLNLVIDNYDESMSVKDLKTWLPYFADFLDGFDENISLIQLKKNLNKTLAKVDDMPKPTIIRGNFDDMPQPKKVIHGNEVNTENLTNWINNELKSRQISMSEEKMNIIVKEAIEIYENQILTLENRTEALQIMQGLILAKLKV